MRYAGLVIALGCALLAASQAPGLRPDPGPWRTTYVEWQLQEQRQENQRLAAEVAELQQQVVQLRGELTQADEAVLAAEQKFQDWLQVLSSLAPELVPDETGQLPDTPTVEPVLPIEEEPGLVRARELRTAIQALLRSEQVGGLDLLEPGRYADGALGPVVFRTLDDRGRLTGSLSAARLRFEAGVAARTVTLVLEDGHELRAGVREPFLEWRLPLVHVDPRPWLERLPELFGDADQLDGQDDGRWDVEALRGRLNELLGRNISGGFHRLRHLGGVDGGELLDLHLVEHDEEGNVRRHLFADRAQLGLTDSGAVISLSGCVAVRGEEKHAFPGGKLRIFLPFAKHAEWRGANLPGITPE